MYQFLAGAAFALLLAVSQVGAQAEPLGSPIFKHAVTKEVLISKVKLGCTSDVFNVTCNEFLGTLQAADAELAPKYAKDLASYLSSLDEGLCGAENEARLATFYASPRRIMFNEVRHFAPDEMCLKRAGKNIVSLKCGNANVTDLKVTLSVPASIKDTVYVRTTVRDSVFVESRAVPDAIPVAPIPAKKKSRWLRNTLIGTGVAVVACVIWCRQSTTVTVNGQPYGPDDGPKGGGPMNPPNIRAFPASGAGIRIPIWQI